MKQKCFNGGGPSDADVERTTIRRLPAVAPLFVRVLFSSANLDRINVWLAALTMNKDLASPPLVFALGATAFASWGYCLFGYRATSSLERSTRGVIARIMITWGLFSCATAFVIRPRLSFADPFLSSSALRVWAFSPDDISTSPIGSRRAIATGGRCS